MDELELERIVLVVHDWGGFVGLAWACDHPERIAALVISDTGFFSDGKWHGMAEAIRGDDGEAIVDAMDRDGFAALLGSFGDAFDEDDIAAYWAPYEEGRGPALDARLLPLDGLREARALAGKARGDRRADAAPLGRRRPVRAARRRRAPPSADPRVETRRARWGRALRLDDEARASRRPPRPARSTSFLAASTGSRAHGAERGPAASTQRKPRSERGFRRAADGIRTHDLLHGKQTL